MACPQIFCIQRTAGGWWRSFGWKIDDSVVSAVLMLDRCYIKPVSSFNIHQKKSTKKNPTVLFDTGARYSCVRAESSHLGKIWRQPDTLFSAPNGTFLSNKESGIELNFTEFSKSKWIAWKFHVLPQKNKSFHTM